MSFALLNPGCPMRFQIMSLQLTSTKFFVSIEIAVVMYIRSSLSHQVLSAGANDLELLIVSVSTLYGKFCNCSLFYRPPSSNVEIFDSINNIVQHY